MQYTPGTKKDKSTELGRSTNGFKYMLKNGTNYIGRYHLYEDLPYTGASHDSNSVELLSFTNKRDIILYNQLNNIEKHTNPISYIPTPTEKDYDNMFFIRYFVKKRNEDKIIEVDSKQYKTLTVKNKGLLDAYYAGMELEWKIKGPQNDVYRNNILIEHGIEDTNKKTINMKTKDFPGLDKLFNNYLEFARII